MEEMDNVVVTVEKEEYSRDGVHKGMYGWICHPRRVEGYWLVNFPQCGEKDDIAEIPVKEEDMKVVRILYAEVNEKIKEEHGLAERNEKGKKNDSDSSGDISGYMI